MDRVTLTHLLCYTARVPAPPTKRRSMTCAIGITSAPFSLTLNRGGSPAQGSATTPALSGSCLARLCVEPQVAYSRGGSRSRSPVRSESEKMCIFGVPTHLLPRVATQVADPDAPSRSRQPAHRRIRRFHHPSARLSATPTVPPQPKTSITTDVPMFENQTQGADAWQECCTR
jgi:hypothetical protein